MQRPPGLTAGPIADFVVEQPTRAPRAQPAQPNTSKSISKAPPQFRASSTGHHVTGTATWYCKTGVSICTHGYPGGMYAAAGAELRVGNWRGRVVSVCGNGRCVNVKLIDWCACGSGGVIDLYSDAFSRLTPLSSGTLSVRVSW